MSAAATPALFSPIQVGNMKLAHRIVLAPLTRYRANDAHIPTDLVVEYYKQRASVSGTLLVTEATFISPEASGMFNAPGIWNDAQIAGWKKVSEFVLVSYILHPQVAELRLHRSSTRSMRRAPTFISNCGHWAVSPDPTSCTSCSQTRRIWRPPRLL